MARAWTIGVDFGGTNIKVGAVTGRGVVARHVVLATREHAVPETFVVGVDGAIHWLAKTLGFSAGQIRGVGVGAPGLIDGERGVIHRLVNVPGGWRGVALKRILERHLGCRCAVDNDVNVVALGEWRAGAGRGTRHSVYLTLGTGVGGGVIANGALVRGASGSAGEIGHTVILPGGPRCACGARGCLEALIGTPAIVRLARAAIRRGSGTSPHRRGWGDTLARLAAREGAVTPVVVSRAAAAGDRAARRIWDEMGGYLGLALSNLINLLNPERIVLGGGVARAWPWFAPRMRLTIRQTAFRVPARACRVVRATLGEQAGIVGGAILVWEKGSDPFPWKGSDPLSRRAT